MNEEGDSEEEIRCGGVVMVNAGGNLFFSFLLLFFLRCRCYMLQVHRGRKHVLLLRLMLMRIHSLNTLKT